VRAATDRFEATIGALAAEQVQQQATHSHGPRTIRWFADQRLAEVAFHRWDLDNSLGRQAVFDEGTAAFLLPMLLETNLPAIVELKGGGGDGSFGLAVANQPDLRWRLDFGPNSMTVTQGTDGSVDATFSGDAAAVALLMYGRRSLADLERDGRLTVAGQRSAAERFEKLYPGP
jgi:hypothetical protein